MHKTDIMCAQMYDRKNGSKDERKHCEKEDFFLRIACNV